MTEPLLRELPWDSEFWGVRTARLTVDRLTVADVARISSEVHQESVEFVYFLACADDPITRAAAADAGFTLVDVRVEMECTHPDVQGQADVRPARERDLPDLLPVARTAYSSSRFFADRHLSRTRCEDFYAEWLTRSVEGWADAVLVADVDGRPGGFISLHDRDGVAQIGLVGVAARGRGQGVGRRLVEGGMLWSTERGLERVTVVTQAANVPAQRLYQRCGFLTSSVGLWYHAWFGAAGLD